MLFYEQPTDPWTEFDFMLLEAYQILQDEICAECGNPIWICRNDDASWVGFKIKKTVCYAKAELEKWQDKNNKADKKPVFGEIPYVVPYSYDESPMPTRRQFYQSLSDKIE